MSGRWMMLERAGRSLWTLRTRRIGSTLWRRSSTNISTTYLLSLIHICTVFVIAHRLSTVRNSNAIMVLEGGRIIERGDHEELIGQKGRYYQLYTCLLYTSRCV